MKMEKSTNHRMLKIYIARLYKSNNKLDQLLNIVLAFYPTKLNIFQFYVQHLTVQ